MERWIRDRRIAASVTATAAVMAALGFLGDALNFTADLLKTVLGTFLFLTIVSIALWWTALKRSRPQLPDPDDIFTESLSEKLWVGTRCLDIYVRQANELARGVFGRDSLPHSVIHGWREKNNEILVCLHDESNRVIGYFDVLPLKEPFRSDFVAGKVRERDIRGVHLYTSRDKERSSMVYLAGFAVDDRECCATAYARRVITMLLAARDYIQRHYPIPPERMVYALAATSKGRRMLERFGFSVVRPADERRDGTDLYALHLDLNSQTAIESKLLAFRQRVSVEWRESQRAEPMCPAPTVQAAGNVKQSGRKRRRR